jgi:hypothetical protein
MSENEDNPYLDYIIDTGQIADFVLWRKVRVGEVRR